MIAPGALKQMEANMLKAFELFPPNENEEE